MLKKNYESISGLKENLSKAAKVAFVYLALSPVLANNLIAENFFEKQGKKIEREIKDFRIKRVTKSLRRRIESLLKAPKRIAKSVKNNWKIVPVGSEFELEHNSDINKTVEHAAKVNIRAPSSGTENSWDLKTYKEDHLLFNHEYKLPKVNLDEIEIDYNELNHEISEEEVINPYQISLGNINKPESLPIDNLHEYREKLDDLIPEETDYFDEEEEIESEYKLETSPEEYVDTLLKVEAKKGEIDSYSLLASKKIIDDFDKRFKSVQDMPAFEENNSGFSVSNTISSTLSFAESSAAQIAKSIKDSVSGLWNGFFGKNKDS